MRCYCILVRHFKKLCEFMLVLLLWTERGEAGSDAFATSVRPPPARERAAADGDGSSTSSRMAWKLVEPAPSYKRKSCVRPSVPLELGVPLRLHRRLSPLSPTIAADVT